jgi:hypothetical protein
MPKKLKNRNLLAAMTLAASLATFGCTTNYNHGNGEPATGSPGIGPSAPTSGTSGSSGGTLPQPMTSSSRLSNSSGDALAIMQRTRGTGDKGRVLGPVNPPATGEARAVSNGATSTFDGTIRQLTVNSSISNPYGPQAAVVSGAGDGFAGDVLAGTVTTGTTGTTVGTTAGTTLGTTAGVTTGATIGATTGATIATPTSAALPLTTGAFATGTSTVTPTVSSAAVTTPTAATSAITLNRGAVGTTGSGLSVTQGANGSLVISNVKK